MCDPSVSLSYVASYSSLIFFNPISNNFDVSEFPIVYVRICAGPQKAPQKSPEKSVRTIPSPTQNIFWWKWMRCTLGCCFGIFLGGGGLQAWVAMV
eukprot:5558546-Amphidinium_carterae.2